MFQFWELFSSKAFVKNCPGRNHSKSISRDNWRPGCGYNQTEGVAGYKSDYSDYNINRKGSDCPNKGEQAVGFSDYNVNKGELNPYNVNKGELNPNKGVGFSDYNVNKGELGDLNIIDCYNRASDAGSEFLFYGSRQQKNDESVFVNKQSNNESFFRSKQSNDSLFGVKQTNKRLEELKGREIRSSPSPERRKINSPLLVRSVRI